MAVFCSPEIERNFQKKKKSKISKRSFIALFSFDMEESLAAKQNQLNFLRCVCIDF